MGPTVEPPETLPADFFDTPTPTPKAPSGAPSIRRLIDETADRYGVPRALAHAVASMESDYNPMARSNKGAQGVMQLMPATARELGVRNRLDPVENIRGGVQYLAQLSQKYKGNPELVLAAYNGGPGRVDRYGGIPPITETQNYVKRGKKLLAQSQAQTQFLAQPTVQAMPETEPPATLPADFAFPETAPVQAIAPVKHPMPEPPGAPKIARLQPEAPGAVATAGKTYWETIGGKLLMDLMGGASRDPERARIAKETLTGLVQGLVNEPARIQEEARKADALLDKGAPPGRAAYHMAGTLPLVGPAIQQVAGAVGEGEWAKATGATGALVTPLVGPKLASKVPGAAKVAGAGVRAAAPDVAMGTAKLGAGYAMEHMLPGAGYLKYAVELPTAYSGAKQVARGFKKGVAASRQTLRDRAQAAAEALAAERAAAQPAPVPLIPEERRLASPPDTSYVRAVPADPLPPSRQLPAPGRPAIITPEPEAPPDTSFVRAVPAEVAEVIPEPLRTNQAAATAAEELRAEMIRNGTITPENVTPITRKSGAEKIVEARNAKAERFVEPFKRFKFSTKDVKDFGETEWKTFADAIGEDVPSPETIEQILFRMRKRK